MELNREAFNLGEIERGLASLPSMIAKAAEEVAIARRTRDIAKNALEIARARVVTDPQHGSLNATDKKAVSVESTAKEAQELIDADYDLETATVKFDLYMNYFVSIRKAASLLDREMKTGGL